MSVQESPASIFEYTFEESDTLRECKFLIPSFPGTLKRIFFPFATRRRDLTFGEFKKVTSYLSQEGILQSFPFSRKQSNDLPSAHTIRSVHSERVYGYSAEYGKPTGRMFAVSLGELLERYFTYDNRESFFDTILKKGKKMVPLEHFNGYLQEQTSVFPHLLQKDQQSYSHSVCERLSTGEKVLIPSQLVYWGRARGNETRLGHPTTNGGGAFYTKEVAALSGIYELIQRDNFFLMWLTKETKEHIDISSIPKEKGIWTLIEKVQSRGIQIYFLNMQRDIAVHSIGCLLVDTRNDFPIIGFGAAASLQIENCLQSSLEEALAILNFNSSETTPFDPEKYTPFLTRNIGRKERLTMWKGPLLDTIKFLWSGKKVSFAARERDDIRFTTKKEELSYVTHLLEEKGEGYEVYLHEVRSRVLKNVGFSVVRVIVPKLFPLYLEETSATLYSDRLAEALGIKKENIRISMLNPYPHPFP